MAIIGLDVGTSRCKGALYAEDGTELAGAGRDLTRQPGPDGRCEMDAGDLAAAVRGIVAELCRREPARAVCASVFGGGALLLDALGRPLTPLIGTTDPRAEAQVARLEGALGRRRLRGITGLTPHCSFALGKWMWLAEHEPGLMAKARTLGTAAELVLAALGAPPVCDRATASTTLALDALSGEWSPEVVAASGLSQGLFPQIRSPGEPAGEMPAAVSAELGAAPGCLVVCGGHDQQVCALGAGVHREGLAAHSLGTVECVTAAFSGGETMRALLPGAHPVLFHVWERQRAALAYHYCGSDLWAWAARTLALPDGQDAVGRVAAAWGEKGTPILALPHFAGSATPWMDARARGIVSGLSLAASAEEVLAGILQGQTLEIRLNLELWRSAGLVLDGLLSFGGGARWDSLLQWKADLLRLPMRRAARREPGCFGAFLLALRALAGPEAAGRILLAEAAGDRRIFEPRPGPAEIGDAAYARYRRLAEWSAKGDA